MFRRSQSVIILFVCVMLLQALMSMIVFRTGAQVSALRRASTGASRRSQDNPVPTTIDLKTHQPGKLSHQAQASPLLDDSSDAKETDKPKKKHTGKPARYILTANELADDDALRGNPNHRYKTQHASKKTFAPWTRAPETPEPETPEPEPKEEEETKKPKKVHRPIAHDDPPLAEETDEPEEGPVVQHHGRSKRTPAPTTPPPDNERNGEDEDTPEPTAKPHHRRHKEDAAPLGGGKDTATELEQLRGQVIDWQGNEEKELSPEDAELLNAKTAPTELKHLVNAALVVLCYNRKTYLTKTLNAILKAKLSDKLKLYVSQDGNEFSTQAVAKSFEEFEYLSHPRKLPPILHLDTTDPLYKTKETPGTMFLAQHYKWVLDKLFKERKHSHVIIVEDDMKVSRDFVGYFEQLAPLLDVDPTIWCISSWNDFGFRHFDLPETTLYRTSNFPGLGWMLKRSLWMDELSLNFPMDNWDHWMRATTTSKNRDCISPFLPRNFNIGENGATSNKEFWMKNMGSLQVSKAKAIQPLGDLSYLVSFKYEKKIRDLLVGAKLREPPGSVNLRTGGQDFEPGSTHVVPFLKEQWSNLGESMQINPSFPRTHYKGLVWLKYNDADLFLMDRRVSPFALPRFKKGQKPTLTVVRAPKRGQSCREVCHKHTGRLIGGDDDEDGGDDDSGKKVQWECASDQFDFINDCKVLAKSFDGCPNGCTQGWGEDIPNYETKELGHPPQCLVTEAVPTCDGEHPRTIRLCPCVAKVGAGRKKHLEPIGAKNTGESCDEVCQGHRAANHHEGGFTWKCDDSQFKYVNSCDQLKKVFPCTKCDSNYGSDLPNYVDHEKDANNGKCLTLSQPDAVDCSGSHPHTKRLCPCVPNA